MLPCDNLATFVVLAELDEEELFLEDDDELELDELLPQPANAKAEIATTDALVIIALNFIIIPLLTFLYENSHLSYRLKLE